MFWMITFFLIPIVLHPPGSSSQAAAVSVQTTPQNVPTRSGLPHMHSQLEHRPSQRSSSPVGLAKWFGSDVLQQPLPSMPAKVISVDELEYRQWTGQAGSPVPGPIVAPWLGLCFLISGWFMDFYFGALCAKLFREAQAPGVVCTDGRILTDWMEPTWSEYRMHSVVNPGNSLFL